MKRSAQQGFTLIELIMVIVILGILSATALPKFIDLSKDAKIAALEGMKGALQSTANMVHSKALIAGTPIAGGYVDTNGDGAASNASGDVYTVFLYPGANYISRAIDSDGFTVEASSTVAQFRLDATDGCEVQYTTATSATVPPTYVIDSSAC